MKSLTVAQAAYIAGFIEGEGSFVITRNHAKNLLDGRPYLIPKIQTGQKDPIPLNYLLKTTGVGNISYSHRFSSYVHRISGRGDIMDFIPTIYPYLKSPRTRKRAWCVYNLAKLLTGRGTHIPVTDKNYKSRMKIYEIWRTTIRGKRAKSDWRLEKKGGPGSNQYQKRSS